MTYKLEHDWNGLIRIFAPDGSTVAVLEKHASGRPGSGIPADSHAKEQGARAQAMVDALNGMNIEAKAEIEEKPSVDPWVIMDKLRIQHSREIHDIWRPLVAEMRNSVEEAQGAHAALQKIADRLEGLWCDPYGDLESDIRSVVAEHYGWPEAKSDSGLDNDLDDEDATDPAAPTVR